MESSGESFYWYDLETTGIDPRRDRVVQFAGLRTDTNLEPIEEPFVTYVRLAPEILPSVEATLITGITPAIAEQGEGEWQALSEINERFSVADTCVTGFNNIRFDDEFIRFGLYRNLFDPYGREWRDGNSRWDLIDLVRASGALRPDGLEWPLRDGRPVFSLEQMARANNLQHENAHDAMSDVEATLALARTIKSCQPELYAYALTLRKKATIGKLMLPLGEQVCVHVSGIYPNRRFCLAPIVSVALHPTINNRVIAVDLAGDIDFICESSVEEIRNAVFGPPERGGHETTRPGLVAVAFNQCPFIAPISVVREADADRLNIDLAQLQRSREILAKCPDLAERISAVYADEERDPSGDAEYALYDGFISDADRRSSDHLQRALRNGNAWISGKFSDPRLATLAERLKARVRPDEMDPKERRAYVEFVRHRLMGDDNKLNAFMDELHGWGSDDDLGVRDHKIVEALINHGEKLRAQFLGDISDG